MTTVSWDDVPDSATLPQDIYDATIANCELKMSRGDNGKTPKLMAVVEFTISAPERFDGWTRTGYYVLGTNDDPEALDAETVKDSSGWRNLKRLIKSAGGSLDPELENSLESILGQQLSIMVTREQDEQGRTQNRVTNTYPIGEQIPGSLSGGGQAAATPTRRPAPQQAARSVGRPTPAARPAARAIPRARVAASGEVEDEGDEAPRVAPRRVQRP